MDSKEVCTVFPYRQIRWEKIPIHDPTHLLIRHKNWLISKGFDLSRRIRFEWLIDMVILRQNEADPPIVGVSDTDPLVIAMIQCYINGDDSARYGLADYLMEQGDRRGEEVAKPDTDVASLFLGVVHPGLVTNKEDD